MRWLLFVFLVTYTGCAIGTTCFRAKVNATEVQVGVCNQETVVNNGGISFPLQPPPALDAPVEHCQP